MAVISKFAALLLVGALAACAAPSTGPGSASPTGSASAQPGARAGFGTAGPALPTAQQTTMTVQNANFETPSKNITCDMTVNTVRCEIERHDWTPPSRPASCPLAYGKGLQIDSGKADFTCAGDTIAGTAKMILPYGGSVLAGHVQCYSDTTALRCEDQQSHHGFTLAIADYNLY